jgi:hypothetical protein
MMLHRSALEVQFFPSVPPLQLKTERERERVVTMTLQLRQRVVTITGMQTISTTTRRKRMVTMKMTNQ